MKIEAVIPGTPAHDLGIQPGDTLLSINGRKIGDTIDYEFYAADEALEIEIIHDHVKQVYQVDKGLDEELGLEIEPMRIRSCANNCVFCFAHQNPEGVRDALNFKDGDFRFSFLHGHYITMTNMGPKQMDRVVAQHLSPLYISVHVTDPDVRQRMLLYGKDDKLLEKLRFLTDHGIVLHTQIVLCPDWNDGDILIKTLEDLMGFAPGIQSVSIVPVGLTQHRDGLPDLASYTPETAREFIAWFEARESQWQVDGLDRFVYLSDEFFILADLDIPGDDYYGDFSMVENGVGQCRDFANRFQASINMLPPRLGKPTRMLFATGLLANDFLATTMSPTLDQIENLEYEIIPVTNHWLGAESVTVVGLLPARDVITQIKSHAPADAVYLSYRMFNEDGVTLDDFSRKDIEDKLGIPVFIHHEDMLEILQPWV